MTTGLQQELLQSDNVADKPDLLQMIVDGEEIKEFFWAVYHYLQFGYVSQELDFSYSLTQHRSKLSLLRFTADLLRKVQGQQVLDSLSLRFQWPLSSYAIKFKTEEPKGFEYNCKTR